MAIFLFWDVIPYSLVEIRHGFESEHCLLLGTHHFRNNIEIWPEDVVNWILNADGLVPGTYHVLETVTRGWKRFSTT